MRLWDLKLRFIIIDANHDNSGKQYMDQIRIVRQALLNRIRMKKIKKTVPRALWSNLTTSWSVIQNQPEVFGCSITLSRLGKYISLQFEEIYTTLTKWVKRMELGISAPFVKYDSWTRNWHRRVADKRSYTTWGLC